MSDDPMLSPDAQKRENYSERVMDIMRSAVEEDRAERRQPRVNEPPAVVIGATGMPGGLSQSL